jgi:flavin reductase (DIM6/NTAB) family NADH-FMN oxidoreductase RutF
VIGADEQAFLDVMAAVVTPVTVVTSIVDGRPHGTTVSAFCSLSLRPPMVAVALDHGSDLRRAIEPGTLVGINVLGSDHSALALKFARKGFDKFTGVEWHLDHGLPRIRGAPGWLVCEAAQVVEGGDHALVLCTVAHSERLDAPPLAYHNRIFGTHTPGT